MSNKVGSQSQLLEEPYQNLNRNESKLSSIDNSKDTPPVKFSDRVDMMESHPKHL